MNNIDSSLLWLLTPQSVYRYMDRIMKKRQNGQPVSFTDFFGHMVGETLLKGVSSMGENDITSFSIIEDASFIFFGKRHLKLS